MKIKDVEEKTGISIHNIRFYEEMGLLQIQRKKDSTYRNFNAMLGEVSTFCGDKQGGVESYLIAAIRL